MTNVGVHFFDMLHFIFGDLKENVVFLKTPTKASGYLEYERARVRWYLSLDIEDVPQIEREKGKRTYRSLTSNGKAIEFSDGFTDLHTEVYRSIISGKGYGLQDSRTAIETVAHIRNASVIEKNSLAHPMAKLDSID